MIYFVILCIFTPFKKFKAWPWAWPPEI